MCMAAISSALRESLGLCLAVGLRSPFFLGLATDLPPGDVVACRFAAGSTPKPWSMAPHSMSCASILALISRAWSATLVAPLDSSSSFSSSSIRPLRVRFSESSRPHSPSRERMRRDWLELTLAMSRFWRKNFRRTILQRSGQIRTPLSTRFAEPHSRVSMVSVDTGGSFSLAIMS